MRNTFTCLINLGIQEVGEGIATVGLAVDHSADFFDRGGKIGRRKALAGPAFNQLAVAQNLLLQSGRPATWRLAHHA